MKTEEINSLNGVTENTPEQALQPIVAINSTQAFQSLRDSGYSFSAALAELVDNSIEANASTISILLQEEGEGKKKHIHQIAVADDGIGMNSALLQKYLVLGFSTRFMNRNTIGKYGVGAKLAALNFVKRIDVWSRTSAEQPWQHSFFDLENEMLANQEANEKGLNYQCMVYPPDGYPIPTEFVNILPLGSGTLIVWSKSDRLEEGRHAASFEDLKYEVEKELSRFFRYYIDGGISIIVNDKKLIPFDPLYLLEGHWGDYVLNKEFKNSNKDWKHYDAKLMKLVDLSIDGYNATVRVTVYPPEVVRKRGKGGDTLAKQLRVLENKGAISYIRLDREVAYARSSHMFPTAVKDQDRFIGIEVSFKPELDDYFGVRNVKRGVEPHGILREKIKTAISGPISEARKMIDKYWEDELRGSFSNEDGFDHIEDAVKEVDRIMPKKRAKGDEERNDEKALEDLATDKYGEDVEAKQKLVHEIKEKQLPFVIEAMSWPGQNFIEIIHTQERSIIRVNERHRFYQEIYGPLKELAKQNPEEVLGEDATKVSRRAVEALTLLIIAYAKAESIHETPEEQYGDLRMYWGQFLHTFMGKVKDVI